MFKKILAIIFIVIGILMIIVGILSSITSKGPESSDTAFLIGYYMGSSLIFLVGIGLIILGFKMRRRIRNKKIKKELLDSLPGEKK